MFRLAKCLRASASQGVIHCDLKPNNIVISPDGSVKIIDWGIAEIDQSKDQMREKFTNKQTLKWRSPELVLDASETQYSCKIDVFSLGLIFLGIFIKSDAVFTAQTLTDYKKLLLTKLLGLNGKNLKTDSQIDEIILETIQNNTINAPIIAKNLMTNRQFYTEGKPSKIPEDLADLISKMLEFSPTIRASYDEVILHPFFQKMNRESIPKLPRYINNMPIIEDITETWKPVFAMNARLVLFRWLKSLSQSFKLTFDTLCLSFQLLDLLVIRDPTFIRKDNAQTCASVCALLASKLYDIYPSEIEDISYYTDGGSSIQQIKELEREILVLFNGNLIVPSFYTYYSHINGVKKDPKNYEILYNFYLTPDVYKIPFVEKVDSIELL
jgi:serine/threonine protein kinase